MRLVIQRVGLLLAMLAAILPAAAYDFEVDGIYYNITSMSDLEVGVTYRSLDNNSDWRGRDNDSYSGHVKIPATVNYNNKTFTVTSIEESAFGGESSRTQYGTGWYGNGCSIFSVELPSTIRTIRTAAFQGCTYLSAIGLPPNLTSIGRDAFYRSGLVSINIPDGVSFIGGAAFSSCDLKQVVLGKGLSSIGEKAFANNSSLTEVFCTAANSPSGWNSTTFEKAHSALEVYVPRLRNYGDVSGNIVQYLSYSTNGVNYVSSNYAVLKFGYSGQPHTILWKNNLKAYACEISEDDCNTEVGVGSYTKVFSVKYSNGIDLTIDVPCFYEITPAPMTLTVNNAQREYGEPNPVFTYSITGFVNGETEQSIGATPTFECEANKFSKVGDYRILASMNVPNYEVTYEYGTLSVLKAPITVSVANASKVYGEKNPQFEMSYSGLKNDEKTPSWSKKPTFKTIATEQSGAGQYEVNAEGGESPNYDVKTYSPGMLTISKRELTAKAVDCERYYGDANPDFKVSYVGFVNGDDETSINTAPSVQCEATPESSVGAYPLKIAGGFADNYSFTYQDGQMSVKKAPLTVGVVNSTKVYGEENPQFELSYSGLKNGEETPAWSEQPTFKTKASQFSGAGEYDVTVAGGVAPNYDVTAYTPGKLTITKRNLVVKAVDYSRYYGVPNPDFKVSYIGFINGDTRAVISVDPKAECEATIESNVGTYPITVSGGFDDNYNFEYQNGSLEVKPREVGWKNVYNYVTYNDMSLSTRDDYFNYRPVVEGDYDDDVFKIELWYLDGDNRMTNHVTTIADGEYAGNYVSTDPDRPMNVGKYIFNLVPTGTNPNYTANPSQAFVTVTPASNYLEWNASEPIKMKVGETVDLGISYQANIWCKFETDYDSELMTLTSKDVIGKEPHWYATGVKEGETTLTFGINCLKNDMGFYDFTDCEAISKKIIVEPISGIDSAAVDCDNLFVTTQNGEVIVHNAPEKSIVRVFALTGTLITETTDKTIRNLSAGMYIVVVDGKSFKINIR
ncbi:MAG TPA: hypothetical protein DC009_05110 [Porphyromonadaceae bacterium]|nr:hypothetical protein [Porphyromonadaceae bacterium]